MTSSRHVVILASFCLAVVNNASLIPPEKQVIADMLPNVMPPSSSKEKRTFVFLMPPASFAHHEIAIALELQKRGHSVAILTLPGLKTYYDSQYKHIQKKEELGGLEYHEVGQKFSWNINGVVEEASQTRPSNRKARLVHFNALMMYEKAFQFLIRGLENAQAASLLPIFSHDESLFIIPGPWTTPARYCIDNNLPYVVMLPTANFASLYSQPIYAAFSAAETPGTGSAAGSKQRTFFQRTRILYHAIKSAIRGTTMPGLQPWLATNAGVLRLVDGIPALTTTKSYSPLTVFTGPIVSEEMKSLNALSLTVQHVLSRHLPVIYISLGSYAVLSSQQIDLLSDAFLRDEWGVVWALPRQQQALMSSQALDRVLASNGSMAIEHWIQTPAVLRHSNVALFVSHCGYNGLVEAVAEGKPVLGLPLFGDQFANCAAMEENIQTGRCLSIFDSSAEELVTVARTVVHSNGTDALTRNARRAKSIATKAYRGEKTAADWLEAAADVRGDFSFMQTPPEREGVLKAYCLDIFGIALLLVIVQSFLLGCRCGQRKSLSTKRKGYARRKGD